MLSKKVHIYAYFIAVTNEKNLVFDVRQEKMYKTTLLFGEELLAPRPTPKLEEHPLSAVRDRLFNINIQ